MHAAAAGQADTVEMLLKKGANPNERDNMGWSALHHAVSSGGLAVTKLLVEAESDIHAKTSNGATGTRVQVQLFSMSFQSSSYRLYNQIALSARNSSGTKQKF